MHKMSLPKAVPLCLLAIFISLSLLFPMYLSSYGVPYCPDYILVNGIVLLYIGMAALEKGIGQRIKTPAVTALLLLILCFNAAAFYINLNYHHWFWGQINITISLLFFVALILTDQHRMKEQILRFLLVMIIATNIIGFIPYFKGYFGIWMHYNQIELTPMTDLFGEKRYNWIYFHKSEYALMLLLFLGLIVTYRDRFAKKWLYWLGIGAMMAGLVISNTLTSVASSVFIFAGLLADAVRKQPKHIQKRYLLALIPVGLVLAGIVVYIATQRNLLSLGSRTYIWPSAIREIIKNPIGLGRDCGEVGIFVPEWNGYVNNGHNVFLNMLLQLSVPAGMICLVIFLGILVASILRNRNFLTVGIWIAILIPMNMDWCLLLPQWSIFMMLMYFLFFHPQQQSAPQSSQS